MAAARTVSSELGIWNVIESLLVQEPCKTESIESDELFKLKASIITGQPWRCGDLSSGFWLEFRSGDSGLGVLFLSRLHL